MTSLSILEKTLKKHPLDIILKLCMIIVTLIKKEEGKMAQVDKQLSKGIQKGIVVYLKDYRKEVPKKISKSVTSVFECETQADKVIRNVWLFFVAGVFVFSSILWKFQGNFFADHFPLDETTSMGYW